VAILGFLQREPVKQRKIQAHSGKDDHCGGENPRKISRSEQQGQPNHRHQDRKHGIDNTVAVVRDENGTDIFPTVFETKSV
jgi:hypothetical protein